MADKLKRPLAIMLLVLLTVWLYGCEAQPAASYKLGSSGEEVKEIQRRLKDWGYYKGPVDGKYGEATRAAVIWFQKKHTLWQTASWARRPPVLGIPPQGSGSAKAAAAAATYTCWRSCSRGARRAVQGQGVAAVVLNRVRARSSPTVSLK